MTSSILLLEDDESLGATLEERLVKEGYRVHWARSLSQARNVVSDAALDLAILDVGLPDGSGFDFAKELRKTKTLPFLFLTAMAGPEERVHGYEIGAEEFIPKPFHLRELLLRVRHVLERKPVGVQIGDALVDFEGLSVSTSDGKKDFMTPRDARILRLLWDLAPNVVSRDRILEEVWGGESFPTNRTVDNSIVRIRQLLGDANSNWIRSVRGVGYQLMKGRER